MRICIRFQPEEHTPQAGETITVTGGLSGLDYEVRIHRVLSVETNSDQTKSVWVEGVRHYLDSGDREVEHTAEMIALLEQNGLHANSWVYGSYCRPLSGTWFRVPGATLIQTGHNDPYTYAVVSEPLPREDVNANELDLVSRPARKK